MAGKVLSIEVGYSFTKVCEVDFKSQKTKIYNSFTLPTPDGLLADGFVSVNDKFVGDFKQKLAELKIKTRGAIFSVSSSKIATREVKIPYCKENRIGDLVRSNLQDYFPIDVSQYMVAHNILEVEGVAPAADDELDAPKKVKGTPTGYKLLLLAVPFQIIESYRAFASELGLEIKEIDYCGNSIYQAAKEVCNKGTQMIIKIDERSTFLLILKNGSIVLNRTIPYGIDAAMYTLMGTSVWGDVSNYEEAVNLSKTKVCILPRFQRPEHSKQREEVLRDKLAVTMELMPIASGISKVVDYYNSNNMGSPIEQVYLTGMGADISAIPKLLGSAIGMKMEKLTHLTGVNMEKTFADDRFGEYVACIGAALEPVHFASQGEDEKGGKSSQGMDSIHIAALVCAVCMIAGIVMVVTSLMPYLSAKKKNKEYNDIIIELQPVYDVYLEYQTLSAQTERLAELEKQTVNRNKDAVEFIEALESRMPATFTLNDMTTTADGIIMNVTVGTKEEVAVVLDELRKLDMFIFVETTAVSELITEIGESQYSFMVELLYAPLLDSEIAAEIAGQPVPAGQTSQTVENAQTAETVSTEEAVLTEEGEE